MRIRNLITGVESTERRDIAAALIRQGLCAAVGESADEKAARLPRAGDADVTPHFSVGHYEGRYAAIFLKVLGMERRYTGDPRYIHNKRDHAGTPYCASLGFPVPVEIQRQYLALWATSEHEPATPGAAAASVQAFYTFGPDGLPNDAMAAELKARNSETPSPTPNPDAAKVLKQAEKIIAEQEWK
jgi:hypothetical protein